MRHNAKQWREQVKANARGLCAATKHAPPCRMIGEHAHHICYKSHIPTYAFWIVANGIWLSLACHTLAHSTHNGNISRAKLDAAVDAVNAAIPDTFAELRRPYFKRAA